MNSDKIPKKKQKQSFFCCSSSKKKDKIKNQNHQDGSIREIDKFSPKSEASSTGKHANENCNENQVNLQKECANTNINSNLSIIINQQVFTNIPKSQPDEDHVSFVTPVTFKNEQNENENSNQFKLPDFGMNVQRNISQDIANGTEIKKMTSNKLQDNAELHKTRCVTEGKGHIESHEEENKENHFNFLHTLQNEPNSKIRDSAPPSITNHSQIAVKDYTLKNTTTENKSVSNITSWSFANEQHKDQLSRAADFNIIPLEEKCDQIDENIPNEFNEHNGSAELVDDELNVGEPDNRFDTHSVVSSYILTNPKMISAIRQRDERLCTQSVCYETEGVFTQKLLTGYEDTEFEITNENYSDSIPKFIETPKSSNLNFPKPVDSRGYSIASNYHPQLRDIYDKVNRKEKEIKRLNEKINKLISDIRKYEEENKKCERRIEKEESEGEMLRHMLNFLISKSS